MSLVDFAKHYWPTPPDTKEQQEELQGIKKTRMDRAHLQWFMAWKLELAKKLACCTEYTSDYRHDVNLSFALFKKIEEELARLYSHDPEKRGQFVYGG